MDDLDDLVTEWLTLPDVAQQVGLDVGKVRRMLQERHLAAVRRGERNVLSVPAAFLVPGPDEVPDAAPPVEGSDAGGPQPRLVPLPELRGTLNVLADSGFVDEAAVRWLFTPDDSLPGTPVDALRAGRKTEVRRRAQALAF
jgi:hypothetical protein